MAIWRTLRLLTVAAASFFTSGCATIIGNELDESGFTELIQDIAHARCAFRRGNTNFVPEKPFTSDGCTLWPDGKWRSCCVVHDMDYWCGGSRDARLEADQELRHCVMHFTNDINASLMELGVRLAGGEIWPTRWRWGYGWPMGAPMERPSITSDE